MTLLTPYKRPFLSPSASFASSFFGRNLHMQQIRRNLELLSQTDLPILLQGESGTGKDAVAEMLHQQSKTAGSLLKISCLSPLEIIRTLEDDGEEDPSELPTAFTALLKYGGTLLLDGIHELDLVSQGKLLLMLNQHDFGLDGGPAPYRLISTTTADLQEMTEESRFRVDLLYRINAVRLILPPLRQRPEDIQGLIDFFLEKHSRETQRSRPHLSQELLQMMEGYYWPGNIRQLDHLLRNYVMSGSEDLITRYLAEAESGLNRNWSVEQIDITRPVALKEITRQATQDLERQIILRVLQANGWNRQKTAKWLQISYRSLLYKLSDFGVNQNHHAEVHQIAERGPRAANF